MDSGAPEPQQRRGTLTGDPDRDHELLMLARTVWRIVETNRPEYERFRTRASEDDA